MQQEPKKQSPEDAEAANPPAALPEEPTQAIRPEDEAVVAERLRELGYIE